MFTRVHMCVVCKKYKATEKDFHRKRRNKRGWSGRCIDCNRKLMGYNKRKPSKYLDSNGKYDRAKYLRERRKNDLSFRIKCNLRSKISSVIKGAQSKSIELLLGCSVDQWKKHIESKFQDGMSWDNYGEWHIDHIVPCDWFDMDSIMDRLLCFNYKNTQPLWASSNLSKSNRYC